MNKSTPVAANVLELESALSLGTRDCGLMNYMRSPVIVIQGYQDIVYTNPALWELLEKTGKELNETPFSELLHTGYWDRISCWITDKSHVKGESFQLDLQLSANNSTNRWVNARLIKAEWEGNPAVIGFLADIEDRKRSQAVEEQLRQSQKMEAVGRLAGGIAHDINNLLGAIMGFSSVIQAELPSKSKLAPDVENILKACKKGRNVMLNLLGFARKGKYRIEPFTLNERVQEVVNLLKHTISKKISIKAILSEEHIQVHGDPTQIHHAIMNICLNAVDAIGHSGTLTIVSDSTEISTNDEELFGEIGAGTYARVQISDTGNGMDESVMKLAFEPFFTTKPQGEGSGLGLPMVYGTIKNHGGAVIMESSPNEGTIVTLLLPWTPEPTTSLHTPFENRTPSELTIATILLVDDEELIQKSGKRQLEKLGYKVLLADNGLDALRVYAENKDRISAVMLDIVMPIMDGEETLEKLKDIDPDLPVLLASGFSKEEKAEDLLTKGATGFIQKPFDLATLKKSMSKVLDLYPN